MSPTPPRDPELSEELLPGDRATLLGFRQGDRDALAKVYWHYVDQVERFVRAGFFAAGVRVPGMRNPDEVAEVLQETFLRAFSPGARSRYDGIRGYRPYLLRIARNLLIDRARLTGRLVLGDEEGLQAAEPTAPAAMTQALETAEVAETTRAFVDQLEPELSTFVQLRFREERSQEDVAVAMAVSRRRIRTLETRVRRQLLEYLRARGIEPRELLDGWGG